MRPFAAAPFDLACVERQWPIYERSARGRPGLTYQLVNDAEGHALEFVLNLVDLMESIEEERIDQ